MCHWNLRSLFGCGHDSQPLVGVELVQVLYFAKSPPHFLHDLHLLERRVQRIGGGPYGIHYSFPRIIRGNPRFLAGSARGLGRRPDFLAGQSRSLSSVPQPLSFLSDCFEGLPMMVADLTRFLRQSSEPFSLVPAGFRGYAVFPRSGGLGFVTAIVHESPTARVPTVPHVGCPQADNDIREGSTFGEPGRDRDGLPAAHCR